MVPKGHHVLSVGDFRAIRPDAFCQLSHCQQWVCGDRWRSLGLGTPYTLAALNNCPTRLHQCFCQGCRSFPTSSTPALRTFPGCLSFVWYLPHLGSIFTVGQPGLWQWTKMVFQACCLGAQAITKIYTLPFALMEWDWGGQHFSLAVLQ